MKNHFLNFKSITAITLILALFVMQNSPLIFGFGLFSKTSEIGKVNAIYSPTEITLSNGDFENPTSSVYPIIPNSWTSVGSSGGITSGLIDVSQSVYDEHLDEYNLDFNPGKPLSAPTGEDQILMINAESANLSYGYKSSSFVLSSNGYYTISFYVKTQDVNGISSTASVYLDGDDQITNSDNSKLLSINTYGEWELYKFFVETDSITSQTLNLEFYLGSQNDFTSQGAVFFDEVHIYSVSNDTYYSEINAITTQNNYKILNLKEGVVSNAVVNGDFEQTINDPETANIGWERLTANNSMPDSEYAVNGVYYIDGNFNSELTQVATSPTDANIYDNTRALLINNINPASIGFKSSDILIEQHKLYKLSVYVKTSDLENGAILKLIQQNPYGEDNTSYTPVEESITGINTTTKTSVKYENWIEYSFLIRGNMFVDSYANLEVWVGDEDTSEVGYAFFDNVTLTEVTTDQFETLSSGSNVQEADFASSATALTIDNGTFNDVTINTLADTYPYTASNWTQGSDSTNFEYVNSTNGVINTNTAHFNDIKTNTTNYDGFSNPGNLNNVVNDDISNNVFMIGNESITSQYFISESTSLGASAYYEFSFYIQTQSLSANNVSVLINTDTTTLITLNGLESDLTWTKYTTYIKTPADALTVTVKLVMGTTEQEISGFAFFDNVVMNNIDEDAYVAAKTAGGDNTNFVDLNYENFGAISSNINGGLYTPLNYTADNVNDVNAEFIRAGVLDTANYEASESNFPGLVNPLSASETNSNVLMISSTDDIYYTYTSDYTYSLIADSYYQVTIYVKTFGLSQLAENTETNDDDETIPYGASIALSGITDSFIGIDTQANQTVNDYVAYNFYINTTTAQTFNIILGLGSANGLTKGYAFFSNISVESIDEDTYTSGVALLSNEYPATNVINYVGESTDTTDTDTDTTDETATSSFDYLLIPTLLLGISVIIAVLGYAIRQINFSKLVRKRIGSQIYDRNRTLAIDHERREVVKERQERLAKLKEDLKELQNQLDLNEKQYKIEIAEFKEAQIAKEEKEIAEIKTEAQTENKKVDGAKVKAQKLVRKEENRRFKLEKQKMYDEKRAKLMQEFEQIEKEIEKLEKEEQVLFEKYRTYKAQVKAIKYEIKQKQKDAYAKNKLKRQQARENRKNKEN
ncbi:MAG: hypothetical protein AB7S44_02295 [Spirochaetales bacterium]